MSNFIPMQKLFILIIFITFSPPLCAQKIFTRHQGWSDLTLWYKVGEHTKVGGDFGYRTELEHFSFNQTYFRPTIVWQKNPLYNVSFAISNFYTFLEDQPNLCELRFAQEASLFWPQLSFMKIDHRLRFEERFYYLDNYSGRESRMRYRLALNPNKFTLLNKEGFYTSATWETFIGLGNNFDNPLGNLHRWEAVFGNKINDRFGVGLHYIWQTTVLTDNSMKIKDNIVRLRFAYKLN
ncbi:DUF2490 domain-containing protein [Reichenbachiella agarivorans]|uniref:DUF2490 domain-containing protein n=1 Tax=Reichenbachiella agarivorans TaxID=2979464 RepID=A0ABY6CYY9_9BACT|nr:DUF2490 domain-containing protein [Reichenbachiella agarivorans]UXP33450.1 DUF2490 domain-containing protein [Reichenbachiella agarivorans]